MLKSLIGRLRASRAAKPDLIHLEAAHLSSAEQMKPAPVNPRGPILIGTVIILVAFGGVGGWAAFAPLDSAVVAHGTVVVESNRRDVQHLDGGLIAEILVKDGVAVAAGDVLIRLDPVRPHAQLAIVRGQSDAARALAARLRAEQDDLPEIVFPEQLLARQDEIGVRDLMRGQVSIFEARRASIKGQVSILQQRISQFGEQIQGLKAQEQARSRQIKLIAEELKGTRELADKGFAPKTRVLALEREMARLEGERGEHLAALARAQQSIGEAELQILQLSRSFREEVARMLQDANNQIRELEERQIAAEDVVNRLEIRAPAAGVVVGLAVTTVGAVIPPGRTVMQIVPQRDTLVIEAQVMPQNVETLIPGLVAAINFTALPQRTMPKLTGTLTQISADRLVDERSGMPYYKARVEIDAASLEAIGDRRLLPGMPADVMIATGERTALRYFLDPLLDAANFAMRER